MSVHTSVRQFVAPADLTELSTLVAEPESTIGDPPLPEPNAAGALLLGLLLSPPTPKEPRK